MKVIISFDLDDKNYENLRMFDKALRDFVEDKWIGQAILNPVDFSKADCFSITMINNAGKSIREFDPASSLYNLYIATKLEFTARIICLTEEGAYILSQYQYYGNSQGIKRFSEAVGDLYNFLHRWRDVQEYLSEYPELSEKWEVCMKEHGINQESIEQTVKAIDAMLH